MWSECRCMDYEVNVMKAIGVKYKYECKLVAVCSGYI